MKLVKVISPNVKTKARFSRTKEGDVNRHKDGSPIVLGHKAITGRAMCIMEDAKGRRFTRHCIDPIKYKTVEA